MGNLETTTDQDALGQGLWIAVAKSRPELERAAGSKAAKGWLKPQLDTPEGTQKVYGMMEDLVAKPGFLAKLENAKGSREQETVVGSGKPSGWPDKQTLDAEWWEVPPPHDKAIMSSETPAQPAVDHQVKGLVKAEPIDSYVLVEKEDVLDAIGSFVAAYLAELPQAQNLPPAELQVAIKNAFKELKKSRLQQLWGWGRAIYRCVSFSYGAFTVYENPWLVRALLTAMWTASRVMFGLLI